MSNFDQFPINDQIVQKSGNLSNIWYLAFSTLYNNLVSYLTSNGILIPDLSTIDILSINSPQNGQIVYDNLTNQWKGYSNGVWVYFNTTPV